MLPIKARIDANGRIPAGEALAKAKIRPGDWVEIIAQEDRLIVRPVPRERPQGVVRSVARSWGERTDLVEELLRIREDEDDRPDTTLP